MLGEFQQNEDVSLGLWDHGEVSSAAAEVGEVHVGGGKSTYFFLRDLSADHLRVSHRPGFTAPPPSGLRESQPPGIITTF